ALGLILEKFCSGAPCCPEGCNLAPRLCLEGTFCLCQLGLAQAMLRLAQDTVHRVDFG
ncbi:hypothetical protein A2U01_0099287, partial [Trifolium medium]|nr:hypothetical protein [Trifolium medium]